ncbi:MAG: hypothetical protein ACP5KZ_09580 [bacterium]
MKRRNTNITIIVPYKLKQKYFVLFVILGVVLGGTLSPGEVKLPKEIEILLGKMEKSIRNKIVTIEYTRAEYWKKDGQPASRLRRVKMVFSSSLNFVLDIKEMDFEGKKVSRHLVYTFDGKKLAVYRADKQVYHIYPPGPAEAYWGLFLWTVYPPTVKHLEAGIKRVTKEDPSTDIKMTLTKEKLGGKQAYLLMISSKSSGSKVIPMIEHKYWIDSKTLLPLKAVRIDDTWMEVYNVEKATLRLAHSDGLFKFNPPKGAREAVTVEEVFE